MAIRVAATLKLADRIERGTTSITELAGETETNPEALARLMHFLTSHGIFTELAPGRVGLSELARPLLDDHPWGSRGWFDMGGAIGRADLSFTELLHSVRSGSSGYPKRFGRGFWEDLAENEQLSRSFDDLMSAQLLGQAPAIVNAIDWTDVKQVADIGGGDGTLLEVLLLSNLTVRATLVDLPGPIRSARNRLASAGLIDRVNCIAQSFFDPLPRGADRYLLCGVLSDWSDERAIALLRGCANAAGNDGRILVIGGPYQEENPEEPTEMDLRMLLYFGGRERNLSELSDIALEAGLTVRSIIPAGQRSIIELLSKSCARL